jgi:hypothetical protein
MLCSAKKIMPNTIVSNAAPMPKHFDFDDCAMSAYETFKNALLGLDEEMYHRIGSIAEIQKLIFTYCKGFSQSANIQAFHDLSDENDLELALDITHLSFRTLTWAMNLNDDFAVAPVSYLD